ITVVVTIRHKAVTFKLNFEGPVDLVGECFNEDVAFHLGWQVFTRLKFYYDFFPSLIPVQVLQHPLVKPSHVCLLLSHYDRTPGLAVQAPDGRMAGWNGGSVHTALGILGSTETRVF